jgi:hypothetical protein
MIAFPEQFSFALPTADILAEVRYQLDGLLDDQEKLMKDCDVMEVASKVLLSALQATPHWKLAHWRVLSVLDAVARCIDCDCCDEPIQQILIDCTRTSLNTLLIMRYSQKSMTAQFQVDCTEYFEIIERVVKKTKASL